MKVEIKIDEACKEPRVMIQTAQITEEVTRVADYLSKERATTIAGIKNGRVEILKQEDIYRFYAENGKVFGETKNGTYQVRLRLYELEERVDSGCFARISNAEIVNLQEVESLDLSFSGTICMKLKNGSTSYVSRRQVATIKKKIGL